MQEALDNLKETIEELKAKYIDVHTDPLEPIENYRLDVKSFCVLSHAAFEEYIEDICLKVLAEIFDKYRSTGRFSFSTLCLLHFSSAEKLDDEKWPDSQNLYDYLLKKIEHAKQTMSTEIMQNNHGIGMKYLKKMLLPLGLNLPSDDKSVNSLKNLAKYRGGYAHTSRRFVKVVTPNDAQVCVDDVYNMCETLCSQARLIAYYK